MRIFPALFAILLSSFLAAEDLARSPVRISAGEFPVQRPQPLPAHQLLRDSATIFAGTVLSIEHSSEPLGGEAGITRIRFRVQSAIRGVRAGEVIEIREWGGLWNAGERYQRGENVLLFLYPASKLGLTSTVAGAAGRFRMDKTWRVQLGNKLPLFPPIVFRHKQLKELTVRDFAAAIRRAAKEQLCDAASCSF
jgi:hypothetical protein